MTFIKNHFRTIETILCLAGCGISVYQFLHHIEAKTLGHSTAFCNINQYFSCDRAVFSPFSEVFGAPLPVWGFIYFMAGLTLAMQKDSSPILYRMHALIGAVVSVCLALVSLFLLKSICIVCGGIYLVCFFLFFASFHARNISSSKPSLLKQALIMVLFSAAIYLLYPSIATPLIHHHKQKLEQSTLSLTSVSADRFLSEISDAEKLAKNNISHRILVGPPSPKVEMVIFIDLACPACAAAAPTFDKIWKKFSDTISVDLRFFPFHSGCAMKESAKTMKDCTWEMYTYCSFMQGKLRSNLDQIFSLSQKYITDPKFILESLGLEKDPYEKCAAAPDLYEKISQDLRTVKDVGIQGTPTIFLNGKRYTGPLMYEALEAVIIQLLAK